MMPDFSHVDLNSLKLKVKGQKCLPGCGQKWVQAVSLVMGPKIGFISSRNMWNKLIFCMLVQIQET